MPPPKKKAKGRLTKQSAPGGGGKAWRDAIRLELARADSPNGTALERIARILVNDALNGDYVAIQEIANRIDGKVATQEYHEAGEPINKLVVTWDIPRERLRPEEPMKTIEHGPLGPGGSDRPERSGGSEEAAVGGPKMEVPSPNPKIHNPLTIKVIPE